jgi:hypothetical protein
MLEETLKLVNLKHGNIITPRKDVCVLSGYDCKSLGLKPDTAYEVANVKLHVAVDIDTKDVELHSTAGIDTDNLEQDEKIKTLEALVFSIGKVKNAHLKIKGPGAKDNMSYPSCYFVI